MNTNRVIHLLESMAVNYPQDRYQEAINLAIEALSSEAAQPLVLTCDGCRHVGTYDTDFPCSGCIRREKDYYEQER